MDQRIHPPLAVASAISSAAIVIGAAVLLGERHVDWLRIDWTDLRGWIVRSDPETILAGSSIHAAVLASVVVSLSLLARLPTGFGRLPSVVRRTSVRVHRLVGDVTSGIAVGAITLSSLSPALAAAHDRPVAKPVAADTREIAPGFLPFSYTDSGAPTAQTSVRVRSGDTLWAIAVTHLQTTLEREPSLTELTEHWGSIIALNAGRLRSGDPDLIHPGEDVLLPQVRR